MTQEIIAQKFAVTTGGVKLVRKLEHETAGIGMSGWPASLPCTWMCLAHGLFNSRTMTEGVVDVVHEYFAVVGRAAIAS